MMIFQWSELRKMYSYRRNIIFKPHLYYKENYSHMNYKCNCKRKMITFLEDNIGEYICNFGKWMCGFKIKMQDKYIWLCKKNFFYSTKGLFPKYFNSTFPTDEFLRISRKKNHNVHKINKKHYKNCILTVCGVWFVHVRMRLTLAIRET